MLRREATVPWNVQHGARRVVVVAEQVDEEQDLAVGRSEHAQRFGDCEACVVVRGRVMQLGVQLRRSGPTAARAQLVEAGAVDDAVQPRRLVRLVREVWRQRAERLQVGRLQDVVQPAALDEDSGSRAAQPRLVPGEDVLEPTAVGARRRRDFAPTEGGESDVHGELCAHTMVIRPGHGNRSGMTQFEQENDLGRGGGEVDEDMLEDAWENAGERLEPAGDEEED